MPIPASHIALWFAGSLVRGAIRKYPYRVAAAAAGGLGLGAYRHIRKRPVKRNIPRKRPPWRADPIDRSTPSMAAASTASYKRKRSGSEVVDFVGRSGGYVNDVHYKSRKTLGKVNVRKIAKQGTSALYDRWQKMGLYSATNGNMWLDKNGTATAQTGAAIADHVTCPYYIWDLTEARNYVSGNERTPVACFQLLRNAVTGLYWLNPIAGQKIDDASAATNQGTANWQYYSTPRVTASLDSPIDAGLLDWVKIQAVCYGSLKQSHKIWFEICQLDPSLQPQPLVYATTDGLLGGVGGFQTDEQGATNNAAMWHHNQLAHLVDGPFASIYQSPDMKKLKHRVLHRKCIEFQPVASFEENGGALVHKATLNMFVKMGRKCNFNWRINSPDLANNQAGDGEIETKVERGDHECVVHPQARVFLRVYSTTYAQTGQNGWTRQDVTPSIDIRISRKWIISD